MNTPNGQHIERLLAVLNAAAPEHAAAALIALLDALAQDFHEAASTLAVNWQDPHAGREWLHLAHALQRATLTLDAHV
ncbi:MAG TPA: hypothetical protein VM285_06950 [Polyangia bacterium]|nr:hypothetical protein [Polyangia bacterium]